MLHRRQHIKALSINKASTVVHLHGAHSMVNESHAAIYEDGIEALSRLSIDGPHDRFTGGEDGEAVDRLMETLDALCDRIKRLGTARLDRSDLAVFAATIPGVTRLMARIAGSMSPDMETLEKLSWLIGALVEHLNDEFLGGAR